MENKHNNSGISSGFIVGFLLGIIVTLLLTTKRGREIVRVLTEKGAEKFGDLEDILQEGLGEDLAEEDEEIVTVHDNDDTTEKTTKKSQPVEGKDTESTKKSPGSQRFFRRISKPRAR